MIRINCVLAEGMAKSGVCGIQHRGQHSVVFFQELQLRHGGMCVCGPIATYRFLPKDNAEIIGRQHKQNGCAGVRRSQL